MHFHKIRIFLFNGTLVTNVSKKVKYMFIIAIINIMKVQYIDSSQLHLFSNIHIYESIQGDAFKKMIT